MDGVLSPNAAQYTPMVLQQAQSAGIPPALLMALVQSESSFNPNAVGAAGEIGLTQISPSLAQQYGLSNAQLYDPATNLHTGATYLASLYSQFGNWFDALRAYNGGATGATNNPNLSTGYASNILNLANQLSGSSMQNTLNNAATTGGQINPNALLTNTGATMPNANSFDIANPASWVSWAGSNLLVVAAFGIAILLFVFGIMQLFAPQIQAATKEIVKNAPLAAA